MSGRGAKDGAHHLVRRHVGQPLGVGEVIRFATRDVLHVLGVAQPQLLEEAFEGVVDRATDKSPLPPWPRCSPRHP